MPDLLHQLHKGVFKDHLVKWCANIIGEKGLNSHLKAMNSYLGLQHFKFPQLASGQVQNIKKWRKSYLEL